MTKIQNILQSLGYYSVKKTVKDYFFKRRILREDAARKREIEDAINRLSKPVLGGEKSDVIISLTSYGTRVEDALPYTIYSLLTQTILPDKIIVWLDNTNWSDDTLPSILKKLQNLGIEIRYTDDIRSYKKLIPALETFPNSVILTVDDDMYYNPHLVEWLLEAYESSDKHTVLGTYGARTASSESRYLPYSQWQEACPVDKDICLIGCGGILYPPAIFDTEILNKDVFMRLAPRADDLWFWAMEKRAGVTAVLIPQYGYALNSAVDRINDYFPTEYTDNLSFLNDIQGGNDEQLDNLISYYNLIPCNKE